MHPVCALCESRNIITPATVVDHLVPHKGDKHAFMYGPVQSLCVECHNNTKRGIERRGYDRRVGLDGWPTDDRHPAYAKRFST
jgi:5-methylcytosine-specific restriction enzyme A